MEATGLSLGKSVLDGALGYAKSAVAEEVALQLGIQQDQAFIRDELEMMMAFLMAAHEERDEHKVIKTWVKQVRDVAYDAEDCLQDFAVRIRKQTWWCAPRMLLERRRVAKQIKELRAKVEDVSQRNVRYRLIKGSGSKATTTNGQSNMASETMSSTEEARRQHEKAKLYLIRLINKKDEKLRVISVWGTSVPGDTSVMKMAYDDLDRKKQFDCHAWIRIIHPFNQTEFVKSLIEQFFVNSLEEATKTKQKLTLRVQDLRRIWMINEDHLVDEFKKVLNEKSFLIVFCDLSSIEEWEQIKACFPENKKGSRLIVCTEKINVASLCVGTETEQPEHKQLTVDQTIYAFYEKGSQGGTDTMDEPSGSKTTDTITDSEKSMDGKKLARMETTLYAFKESQLIGRENEKTEIIKMISNRHSQEFVVISICGMGGIGKTTIVKYVYQSQELPMFDKRACVTIKRPFNPNELLNSLATQLGDTQMANDEKLLKLLEGKSYLIILDDISSTVEWDAIARYFPTTVTTSRIIITTREENIAKHCSKDGKNIYRLKFLGDRDAHNLFTEKVFGKITYLNEYHELADEAKLILKKCNGLPLAIVTVGGFLAKQPKTPTEWRKLNKNISAELELNPDLGVIKNILIKSYDGLPYHLKSCFLYLSIFPEDYNISRRRLVRRWIAEGYPREVRGKSVVERADMCFVELIDRSMILASQQSLFSMRRIDSCHVHDLMHEISISKSIEENLVFRLEDGCSLNTEGTVRHLAISNNWNGGQSEFEDIVNRSSIRSLTVFGTWRSFFISKKMRMLRVLDLEGTSGLCDHHLEHIGRLVHLKYFSLRGCDDIYYLPHSLGNLQQLETLDIKHTEIIKLPKSIIRLRKLQYLRAGGQIIDGSYQELVKDFPKLVQNRLCMLTLFSALCCVVCCAPQMIENQWETGGKPNRCDLCTVWCCAVIPFVAWRLDAHSVAVPSGVNKLSALHTLGTINIGHGRAVLQDLRRLIRLRKLGVVGVNRGNSVEFCKTLSALSNLESLYVRSAGEPGLEGCLEFDDGSSFSPPKNLSSLKLDGRLVKLPGWIEGLHNLVKLKLQETKLSEVDATLGVLGKLRNLVILRLLWGSIEEAEDLRLTFHGDEPLFQKLTVLQLSGIDGLKSVEFKKGAMPVLELLLFREGSGRTSLSELSSLPRLKELVLEGLYFGCSLDDLREELARNTNKPVLKRV